MAANYRIRNSKPAEYTSELYITATQAWMPLGTFVTLEEAVSFIKTRVDTETFKERIYDQVGRLVTATSEPLQDA